MGSCIPLWNGRKNTVLDKEVSQILKVVYTVLQLSSEQDKRVMMGEKVFFRTRLPRANIFSHHICLQKGITEQAKLIANALIRHLPFAAVESLGKSAWIPALPPALHTHFKFIALLPKCSWVFTSPGEAWKPPVGTSQCPPLSWGALEPSCLWEISIPEWRLFSSALKCATRVTELFLYWQPHSCLLGIWEGREGREAFNPFEMGE